MKKIPCLILGAMILTSIYGTQAFARRGGETSGGGQGVVEEDGNIAVLDEYVDQPISLKDVCPEATSFELSANPATQAGSEAVAAQITQLEPNYKNFSIRLKRFLQSHMKWYSCPHSLPLMNDYAYNGPIAGKLVQGAIQFADHSVVIDQQFWEHAPLAYTSGQIAHEMFLGYLGLTLDRDRLRQIVRAFISRPQVDFDALSETLNKIHPSILAGGFSIDFVVSIKTEGTNNIWIPNSGSDSEVLTAPHSCESSAGTVAMPAAYVYGTDSSEAENICFGGSQQFLLDVQSSQFSGGLLGSLLGSGYVHPETEASYDVDLTAYVNGVRVVDKTFSKLHPTQNSDLQINDQFKLELY